MHVVFPTTPAQYFHLLRRQMKRNFRKPLIVAGPKALLRLPVSKHPYLRMTRAYASLQAAASSLEDMSPGSHFMPVLTDLSVADPDKVKRVAFLTGKLYYDLVKARTQHSSSERVAFVRVEELSPFPFHAVKQELQKYRNAQEVVWVQEEPRNQGAWGFVEGRLRSTLAEVGNDKLGGEVRYVGRKEAAIPAPGVAKLYKSEQQAVIVGAFEGL